MLFRKQMREKSPKFSAILRMHDLFEQTSDSLANFAEVVPDKEVSDLMSQTARKLRYLCAIGDPRLLVETDLSLSYLDSNALNAFVVAWDNVHARIEEFNKVQTRSEYFSAQEKITETLDQLLENAAKLVQKTLDGIDKAEEAASASTTIH